MQYSLLRPHPALDMRLYKVYCDTLFELLFYFLKQCTKLAHCSNVFCLCDTCTLMYYPWKLVDSVSWHHPCSFLLPSHGESTRFVREGWSTLADFVFLFRIPAGTLRRFDLMSLPPQCVGICGTVPRFKWSGTLGKLLKSHTASLCNNQNCRCHSDSEAITNDIVNLCYSIFRVQWLFHLILPPYW